MAKENVNSNKSPYFIGFDDNSKIYFRARKTLNETEYSKEDLSYLNIQGSEIWLHNNQFVNNGSERTFEFDNSSIDIADFVGNTYSYITFSRSGILFPKPNYSDFIKYKVDDVAGNETYTIKDVKDFYQKQTALDNSTVYYSGWREGSRISFQIIEMEPIYDELPYETHQIIIPSGNCTIEGEMGYLGQAESSIFTEGIELRDETEGDLIKEQIYGPNFISPVLKRVPFFDYYSGTFESPTLEAPSIMKVRVGTGYINPEQDYSGLYNYSPYNYNKLLWPALSDLRILNPDETLEELPPDDGSTFLNSTILISASQSQILPNGNKNPNNQKRYIVRNQYQMYDSLATDAIINSGIFLTSKVGFQTELNQPTSGYTVPVGTTLTEITNGLI